MSAIISTKKANQWMMRLAIISLFTPFVYMEIGPKGILHYGNNVPDIYILGGYILGKDTSFWGINFAYKFQLTFILIFTGLIYSFQKLKKSIFIFIGLTLLICFPLWLQVYISGVKNNSDSADLTIYPMPGLLIWAVILILNVWVASRFIRRTSTKISFDN
ncbi:MAG: hypothetical protein FGM61_03865 [Sediminibacterium sp.]|nr:hypothetical protein [Sediminibacterium sp.]